MNEQLCERLPPFSDTPTAANQANANRLAQAMSYACLNGGKRLRASLVYACGELYNAPIDALDKVACALEAIHAYSLVHDDLPAMDNDDLRRGKPTTHIAFDQATALLAGDALQTFAFELIADLPDDISSDQKLDILTTLSRATGYHGMAGGQAIDLSIDTLDESTHVFDDKQQQLDFLKHMHALKTGALITASVVCGALCGKPRIDHVALEIESLREYGYHLGLLFQITDDMLDNSQHVDKLGKTAGKDKAANKLTYVTLLGDQGAAEQAQYHHQLALVALAKIPHNIEFLKAMTDFVIQRDY